MHIILQILREHNYCVLRNKQYITLMKDLFKENINYII